MDGVVRVLFFVVIGGTLLVANIWFIRAVHGAVSEESLIIAPVQVIDAGGTTPSYGGGLAALLQASLADVAKNLKDSQNVLLGAQGSTAAEINPAALVSPGAVNIPTALLDPVNIDVAVAGVDVKGFLPWVQRRMNRPQTLSFSMFIDKENTIVTGDIYALTRTPDRSIRIESTGLAPTKVIERLAHALIQKQIATDPQNPMRERIGALDLDEFEAFVDTISTTARLKVASTRGDAVPPTAYAALYAKIDPLVKKSPSWYELSYLGAELADRGDRPADAIALYRSVSALPASKNPVLEDLRTRSAARVMKLEPVIGPKAKDKQSVFVAEMERYAKKLGLTLPKIEFVPQQQEGVMALWNNEHARYEVNPATLDKMKPQVLAVEAYFLSRHYDRCFGKEQRSNPGLWNDYRYSVENYIVTTDPTEPIENPLTWIVGGKVDRMFKHLDARAGRDATRRFAIALLEAYGCDWNQTNLTAKLKAFNTTGKFVPDNELTAALQA
jgi:hypothetical protein